MPDAVKEALEGIPRFVQDFVNLTGSPRSYASTGRVFDPSRFAYAITFLGISLIVTAVIKAPMVAYKNDPLQYLAGDAIWKFFIVLIETVVIALTWRLFRGQGGAGNYLVANCFYFGVLSVWSHLISLLLYAVETTYGRHSSTEWLILLVTGGPLTWWALLCWRTYGDFNRAGITRTAGALLAAMVASIPMLWAGALLCKALTGSVFGGGMAKLLKIV
jgi:hypothetical protein